MSTVISVESLSKTYHLGQIGTGTFTQDLSIWWAKMRGKPNPMLKIGEKDHGNRDGEEIWALKDVSFKVEQGEVLGIIGRNGAGKSTLLKILSRVTAPTSGRVKVKGRIASLLEVGTGFHPELTGRENIFLNGAILGMNKKEVMRKFDEILDFSGVEKFIDTPVKRYSSGMYVRLAFAVAAHLEPEILVVDEVLAVGDIEFQNKCINKMQDVSKEGRAVLLVSHNMGAIIRLASSAILLDRGQIVLSGLAEKVVEMYTHQNFSDEGCKEYPIDASKDAQILKMTLRNSSGLVTGRLNPDEPFTVDVDFVARRHCHMYVSFMIERDGMAISHTGTFLNAEIPRSWEPGQHRVRMIFPGSVLNAGDYTVWAGLAQWDRTRLDTLHRDGLFLHMSEHSDVGTRGPQLQTLQGVLAISPAYQILGAEF